MRTPEDIRGGILRLRLEREATTTASEARVSELERQWGETLPADYRCFLRTHCPGYVGAGLAYRPAEPNPWTPGNGLNEPDLFFGLTDSIEDSRDIRHAAARYHDRLPAAVVPIADTPGGNLLCIGLRGAHREKVYFWDHERRGPKELYLVANTFLDFVGSFEESPSVNDDDGPIGIWVADDL